MLLPFVLVASVAAVAGAAALSSGLRWPFDAFAPVVAGAVELDGYERLADLEDEVVFRRAEPSVEAP